MSDLSTYSGRLAFALQHRAMSQSDLAREITKRRGGREVKPQTVQYLCDINKKAQGSKYTTDIAAILGISADWLSTGRGPRPGTENESTRLTKALIGRLSGMEVNEKTYEVITNLLDYIDSQPASTAGTDRVVLGSKARRTTQTKAGKKHEGTT